MDRITRKRLIMGGTAALVLAGLVYAFWPKAVPVRIALPSK